MNLLILSVEPQLEIRRIVAEARKKSHSVTFRILKKGLKVSPEKFDTVLFRAIEGKVLMAEKIAEQFVKAGKVVVDEKIARRIDRNKLENYVLFGKENLFVPETFLFKKENLEKIKKFKSDFIVLKPIFGKRGKGIRRVHRKSLETQLQKLEGKDYIAQEFVNILHEYRVYVVGNKYEGVMEKISDSWLHNINQGATPKRTRISDLIKRTSVRAAKSVATEIAGIDIGITKRGLFIIEVNRSPGFKAFESLGYNLAEKIVVYLEEKTKK
ncbi:MAG: ATP-grasp domain-containing protein, partial [archaeon]|nr:ATP-grasp domain-containing protein [archaeon]